MIPFLLSYVLATTFPTDKGSIASQLASYDGSALHLEGGVSIEHGFGTMKAETAILTREEERSEEFPFTSIELSHAVQLALSTSAQVECEKAVLDFSTLKGTLTSPQQVHYIDTLKRENKEAPFELFSPQINLQMVKNPQKKEAYDIEKAHATHGVHLIYDKLYHLETESIVFSQNNISSDGKSRCLWSYQNDRLHAERFDLDLALNELSLQKAAGHITSFSQGTVQFTADALRWNHTENHLTLQGSPHVQESSLGTIVSDHEIDLLLKEQTLHRLTSTGKTTLTSQKGHRLTTEGSVMVDGENHLATIQPSINQQQLLYEEEEMSLHADQASIRYKEDDHGLHPDIVELQGHIKIFSQEKEGPSRRGIADTLTYHPDTRTCILKAHPGQKVLFIRDQDQLRLSANEVHITYDPVSKQQQVQGIGHVALSFSPEEQQLLNKVFRHGSSSP